MIIVNTYDEAKLEAIYIISNFDNYPSKITITYDEKHNWWVVDYDDANREKIDELDEKGLTNAKYMI